MIATYRNSFSHKPFDATKCGLPSEKKLSAIGGRTGAQPYWGSYFIWNYMYTDLRGQTWDDTKKNIDGERRLFADLDQKASNKTAFETMIDRFEKSTGTTLDLGTNSICMAISAAGGAPIASCRGHQASGYHGREPQPIIMFFAQPELAEKIIGLVDQLRTENKDIVMLNNTNMSQGQKQDHADDRKMIVLSSNCITNFIDLAELMYNAR